MSGLELVGRAVDCIGRILTIGWDFFIYPGASEKQSGQPGCLSFPRQERTSGPQQCLDRQEGVTGRWLEEEAIGQLRAGVVDSALLSGQHKKRCCNGDLIVQTPILSSSRGGVRCLGTLARPKRAFKTNGSWHLTC